MKTLRLLPRQVAIGLGILLFPSVLLGLDPARSLPQYNCRTWTRQTGLPVNGIRAICQTSDGYIWLGSQKGLIRFDGIDFSFIDLPDQPQFRNQIVGTLAASKSGGLWFGMPTRSFAHYDGHKAFRYLDREPWVTPDMGIKALKESEDGHLWVGSTKGMALWLDGNTNGTFFRTNVAWANAFCEDAQHRIWIGTTEQGIFCWSDGQLKPLPDESLKKELIWSLAVDNDGKLWVGTHLGLRCYDANLKRVNPLAIYTEVPALLVDRHGALWIGTSGDGLARYQDGQLTYLRQTNGLAHDSVTSLMQDQEGSLWIGTREGLSQISDVKFPIFSTTDGLAGGACLGVCTAKDGGIWTATTHGISWYNGKNGRQFGEEAGLHSPYVKRVLQAKDGDLYVMNGGRQFEIFANGKVVACYTNESWPTAMAEDAHGVVVSVGGNLFRVSRTEFVPMQFRDGRKPELEWVRDLAGAADGSLLVASVNGVFQIKDGVTAHWNVEEGLPSYDVMCVTEQSGVIWAGFNSGLARIETNHVRSITPDHGLTAGSIYAIVPDRLGNIWCNSTRGIVRLDQSSLDAFAAGQTKRIDCTLFDGLESVKTIDTTDMEYVGCRTADGRIWFPSPQGVIGIDPEHLPINNVAPPVHIIRVSVNGKAQTGDTHETPKPGKGDLEFHYTGLSYIAPQKVHFRYQLEGYDPDWIDAGTRRSAFYTNLRPGKYSFRVQACNTDGVWSTAVEHAEVELAPNFYQTRWFYYSAGLAGVAILFGVFLGIARHLRRKHRKLEEANQLLESKIAGRTRELAEQHHLLRTLIDHLPDNIFVKDPQNRILLNNLAHAHALGAATPEEVVGKTDMDFFPRELAEKFRTDERKLLETGEPFNGEETGLNRSTGQQQWSRTTKVPLRDAQGKIIGIAGINRDITERKQWEAKLAQMHKQLLEASRQAGMAEVATSVLHNVGNVLNSVNVSASIVEGRIKSSEAANIAKVVTLLRSNEADLANFLTHDDKGKRLLHYMEMLVQHLEKEKASTLQEVKSLVQNVEHIKEIVAMQQTYARVSGVQEVVQPAELMEDALRMHEAAYERHGVHVVREFAAVPLLTIDRHKVIQVLVNLVQNAKYACDPRLAQERRVTLRVAPQGVDRVRFEVADNGIGIPRENLTRIFSHGFTTRKDGHGFGLHSSALAAKELSGTLTVQSDGVNCGATFVLEVPVKPAADPHDPKPNFQTRTFSKRQHPAPVADQDLASGI